MTFPVFRVEDALDNIIGNEETILQNEIAGDAKATFLMSKTLDWSLGSAFCHSSHDGKTENWTTTWSHKSFQDLSNFEMKLQITKADDESINVQIESIEFHDLPSDGELTALISKSQELGQPSFFFQHFKTYLTLYKERRQFLSDNRITYKLNKNTGQSRVLIKATTDDVPLATIDWSIEFDLNLHIFEHIYSVGFSQTGSDLAASFEFPEELLNQGFTGDWSAMDCIKNLKKLSSFADMESEEGETQIKRKKRNK